MTALTLQVGITADDEVLPILPNDHGRGWVAINTDVLLYPESADECARLANAFTGLGNSWLDRDRAGA